MDNLELLGGIVQIAKYLQWQSEIGDDKAQELMNEIHAGKYGSSEGIWVQADKALEALSNKSLQTNY